MSGFSKRRKRHWRIRPPGMERLENRMHLSGAGADPQPPGFFSEPSDFVPFDVLVADANGYIPAGTGTLKALKQTDNINAADTTNADQLWSGGGLGLSLTGSGVTVGVWDGGYIRTTHQEFAGRVTVKDTGGNTADHATHVGGTIGATGLVANAHGMANQVALWSYEWNNDTTEMGTAASTISLSNHSYGFVCGWTYIYTSGPNGIKYYGRWYGDRQSYTEDPYFGKYDTNSRALDTTLYNNPGLLSIWAASNDRGNNYAYLDSYYLTMLGSTWYWIPANDPTYPAPGADGSQGGGFDCLPQMQTAKNNLVVGSIADVTADPYTSAAIISSSFSSWGPTDDGRIKPDVVGNGENLYSSISTGDAAYDTYSGTSMATPNVTGTTALLLQDYRNLFGSSPTGATLKALLIQNAFDGGNVGPDYSYGWGLVDAAAAANFMANAAGASPTRYIRQNTYNGSEYTWQLSSSGAESLKATIAWTDPAGTAQASGLDVSTSVLVNDLDLWITGPTGTTYYPWTLNPASPSTAAVRTAANHRDNVEQVLIDAPSAGIYTIHVGRTGGLFTQNYSLLVSGASVDSTPPTIESVNSSTGNGWYKAGSIISVTVSFSENVFVSGGTPSLALNSGGSAAYSSGSGTASLAFTYTVATGQNSADLDYVSTGSLILNGATAADAAGNHAVLTLPAPGAAGSLGANKNIGVDTTVPTLTWGTPVPPANGAGWNNTNVSVPFTAADSLSGIGSTVPVASPLVLLAEGSSVTGQVTVTDVAGNSAVFTSAAFSIDKTAPANPLVTAPSYASVVRAFTYTISGNAEANSLVQVWGDANNNGLIDGPDAVVAWQQLTGGGTAYTINTPLITGTANNFTVTATDIAGNPSAPADVPTITQNMTVYVDDSATGLNDGSSWANACTSLQAALESSIAGQLILVAQGTYKPTTGADRTISFALKSGVELRGGYAGHGAADPYARDFIATPSILSGDIGATGQTSDNSYHVVTAGDVDATAVLQGFTITAGNASGAVFDAFGGGMYIDASASPVVQDCTFTANAAASGGAGACGISSAPTFIRCAFDANTTAGHGGGIYGLFSTGLILACTFTANSAKDGAGVFTSSNASPAIVNCEFIGNVAAQSGGGLCAITAPSEITNCTFAANRAGTVGGGICSMPTPTLRNSILWGNSAPSDSQLHAHSGTSDLAFSDIQYWTPDPAHHVAAADPLFLRNPSPGLDGLWGTGDDDYGDLRLALTSPVIDAGDNAAVPSGVTTDIAGRPRFIDVPATPDSGGGTAPIVDMGAYESTAIVYVDASATGPEDGTSWANAYSDLQAALQVATAGSRILVAAGTYYPTDGTDRAASFHLRSDVTVEGGYAGDYNPSNPDERDIIAYPTTLSGNIGNWVLATDNSYHVVVASGTTPTTVLDGFTITDGNADGYSPDDSGGGLYIDSGGLIVRNCTISGNAAVYGGGVYNNAAFTSLANCIVRGNSASGDGGGMENVGASTTDLAASEFIENVAAGYGGGVDNWGGSSLTLNDCAFRRNYGFYGGGISSEFSTFRMIDSTFAGNSATSQGGAIDEFMGYSSTLIDCTFVGNKAAQRGGGFNTVTSSTAIFNSTFTANSATWGGGLSQGGSSGPTVANCVFWDNSATDGPAFYGSVFISFSDVQDYTPDPLNHIIVANPLFRITPSPGFDGLWGTDDDDYGDLRLLPGSPCIDAGSNSAVPPGLTADLAGNPRFVDVPTIADTGEGTAPIVDMGAYEAQAVAITGTSGADSFYVQQSGTLVQVWAASSPIGDPTWSWPAAGLASCTIDAQAGVDDLTIAATMQVPIYFAGGAGLDDLTINGSTVVLAGDEDFGSLIILGSGRLEVGAAELSVDGGDLSALTTLVSTGYAGGAWDGPGINSHAAAANPLTGLALAQETGLVRIRYTYNGDVDMDGLITPADYFDVDSAYLGWILAGVPATEYGRGDLNYDGLVNGADYTLMDAAYYGQTIQLGVLSQAPSPPMSSMYPANIAPEEQVVAFSGAIAMPIVSAVRAAGPASPFNSGSLVRPEADELWA